MNEVLVKLLSEKAVRLGQYSWQWLNKAQGNPSLKNAITSKMFRANLVEVVNGEMKLTITGRMLAEKLNSELKND